MPCSRRKKCLLALARKTGTRYVSAVIADKWREINYMKLDLYLGKLT